MRITGGSYGIGGKLAIAGDGIAIRGAIDKRFLSSDIARVNTSSHAARSFNILAFLIWGVVFGGLGGLALGVLGLLIGVIAAVAAGFSMQKILSVEVHLRDGTTVQAEGWHYEIQKLARLAAQ